MSTKLKLWIVGQALDHETSAWEFQGVFDTEEAAVKVCTTEDYFVGPAKLNEQVSHATVDWTGAYYPMLAIKD